MQPTFCSTGCCNHYTGEVRTSMPAQRGKRCCFCGTVTWEMERMPPRFGHGPYRPYPPGGPRAIVQTAVSGVTVIDPKAAK